MSRSHRPSRPPLAVAALLAVAVLLAVVMMLAVAATPAAALRAPLPGAVDLAALTRNLDERSSEAFPVWEHREVRGGPDSPIMVSDGVLFRYRDPEAEHVAIVGDFNDWNENKHWLRRTKGGLWKTVIELDPGEWSYLFVVDGEWIRDPDNPLIDPDGPDGEGEVSVIEIQRDEVIVPRPHGFREGTVDVSASYERVDQVTLGGHLEYNNFAEMHPQLRLGGGYSFGRERWLYDIELVQPFLDARVFDLGGSAYRRTATPDGHRIGDVENSLATFFFREDWRDYYEAEGVSAHATLYVGRAVELGVRWKSEEHRSVSKTTDWGLFGGNKRMRLMLPVDEGELRSVSVGYDVDTRNSLENPSRGFLANASWEWAGAALGGDFEFQRGMADFRRYLKLSRGHFLDFRFAGGVIGEARRGGEEGERSGFEAIPVQERFYLGGIGTMRATQFKSLTGDRMFLANAEMRVEIFDDFQAVVFTDVGDAWVEDDVELDLKVDAGIGFQDSDSSFRINFAKKMDREDDEGIFVSARIRRMF